MKKLWNIALKYNDIIDIILLCMSFFEIKYLPHLMYIALKYSSLLYLFFKYRNEMKNIKTVSCWILLYGFITSFSSIVNNIAFNTCVASVMYMLQIVVCYLLFNNFIGKYGSKTLCKTIFITLGIYAIFADLLLFIVPYNLSSPKEVYLIGSKFAMSYLHAFLLSLLAMWTDKYIERRKSILLCFVAWVWTVYICAKVTCTTGVLLILIMGIMFFIPNKMKRYLISSKTLIMFTFILNFLILSDFGLFENPLIASFIKNVLKKTSTFKGRLIIFKKIFDIINESIWIGYGYFSSIVQEVVTFGNPQNGVLKILIDSGLLGLGSFIGITYYSNKGSKSINKLWPIYTFVYGMIIASTVEITLTNILFFAAFAMINANNDEDAKLNSERKEVNMNKTIMSDDTLKKLHSIELDIMDEIHRICVKHDIVYYLAGGSVLGAVRHKGFIPWDDDIDICMPRKDYEKFCEICKTELNVDYFLQNESTDKNYGKFIAKVRKNNTVFLEENIKDVDAHHGIFVDIFILDDTRKNVYIQKLLSKSIWKLTSVLAVKKGWQDASKTKTLIYNLLDSDSVLKLRYKLMTLFSSDKSEYYVNYGSQYGVIKQTFLKDVYGKPTLQPFEDRFYFLPEKKEEFLLQLYGENYMNLPPIEKRICHNPIKIDFGIFAKDE